MPRNRNGVEATVGDSLTRLGLIKQRMWHKHALFIQVWSPRFPRRVQATSLKCQQVNLLCLLIPKLSVSHHHTQDSAQVPLTDAGHVW